jgi:hypothetical protein
MIPTVKFDHEVRGGVVQIGSPDELAFSVVEVGLHFWRWQASVHK